MFANWHSTKISDFPLLQTFARRWRRDYGYWLNGLAGDAGLRNHQGQAGVVLDS